MLIQTKGFPGLTLKRRYIFRCLSMFCSVSLPSPPNESITESPDDAIHRVSAMMNRPNWEQNQQLKALVSHMSPHTASQIIALNRNNTQLAIRFFNWVCKQSTYCYDLDSKIHLLSLMVSCNLFEIVHKAIIVLIKQCDTCKNDISKLMAALRDMRNIGFRLNYPCYSTLLMCLAKLSMGLHSFLVYKKMEEDGFIACIITYKTIINALCKDGFVQSAEMFFSRVLKLGFKLDDAHIHTSLVLGNCRVGNLHEAFHVFDEMSKPDFCGPNAVTYSILVHGLCESGRLLEACQLKEEMRKKNCQPSTRTYTILVKAFCDMDSTDKGFDLLDEMIKEGCKPNLHTYTILIDGLCREGKIEKANGIFRKMLRDGFFPSTVTYNALINGYCKEGRVVSAFELLGLMERLNGKPNIRTYNELIEGLCKINKPYKAMGLLKKVVDNGITPNEVTYNVLLDGFCKMGKLEMAFKVLNSMNCVGLSPDKFSYTALMDVLFKEMRPEQANGVLCLALKRGIFLDEVMFTSLIDGYLKAGKTGDAFTILERNIENMSLNTTQTFNSFLGVFGKEKKVNELKGVFGKMLKFGFVPSVVTYTILVDGFCCVGDTSYSLEILELMKRNGCFPDVYTYTVVINGLCNNGMLSEAMDIFSKMFKFGVQPNDVTYSVLVKAYVRFGLSENVFDLVRIMVKNGHQPNLQIYLALLVGFDPSEEAEPLSSVVKSFLIGETGVECCSRSLFKEVNINRCRKIEGKLVECGASIVEFNCFLVTGLCKVGRLSEAYVLVENMVKNCLFPDKVVCSYMVDCLCRERKYNDCLDLVKFLSRNRIVLTSESYYSLIVGLRNEGKIEEAKWVVSKLLMNAGVEDENVILPYVEFLVKEDEEAEEGCLEVLQLIEQMDQSERPLV